MRNCNVEDEFFDYSVERFASANVDGASGCRPRSAMQSTGECGEIA